jgi:hypothetical protein
LYDDAWEGTEERDRRQPLMDNSDAPETVERPAPWRLISIRGPRLLRRSHAG